MISLKKIDLSNKNPSDFFLNSILCFLFFSSASPLFEGAGKIYVSLIATLLIIVIRKKAINFSKQSVFSFYALTVITLVLGPLNDAMHGGWDSNTLGFWLAIALPFVVAACVKKNEFIIIIEKTVLFTLLPGLSVWGLWQFYPGLVAGMPQYTYGGFSHYTLGFVNFLSYGDGVSGRFVGFGSEPGLSQIFYTIALYSRLRNNSGKFDWFVLLLCAAILLTKSTAGIFVMFFVLVSIVPIKKLLIYLIIFSPVLSYYVYSELVYHINNKLVGSDSFAARYDRYNDFFQSDFSDVAFGFGNYHYSNVIAPLGIGGYDSLLQFSQRFGLVSLFVLFFIIYTANSRRPIVFLIIISGFLSQSIWLLPVVAFFYYRESGDKG